MPTGFLPDGPKKGRTCFLFLVNKVPEQLIDSNMMQL